MHGKLLKILPPMKDNQYHGTFILHDFEDPFMQEKSVKDESSKFFKFISPIISMWAQRVLQGMPNFISNHTSEGLLRGSDSVNNESMMYMYRWITEEHQPITFPQAEFVQDYIVHCSLYWNSRMSLFEERG